MERYPLSDETMEATYRVPPARRRLADVSLRHMALAAGFLTCLVVLGVSVWSALTSHRGGTPPVIEAGRGPIRVRPENPGGMQLAGQNEDILSADPSARSGQLAPGPEAPAPQALRARQQEAAAAAAAAAQPPPAPQPVSLPPPTSPMSVPSTTTSPPIAAAPAPAPASAATAAAPGARPATPAANGRVQAQLAAVGSEQAAKSEWQRLARKMPDLLGSRQLSVVKVDRDGQVVWRVRTGGFADRAQASAFCDQVKAKGANCTVAVN